MSPIPNFDHNHVIPPHLGNPTNRNQLSPYPCTILEVCQRFSTSPERIQILIGLVNFRIKMTTLGITNGFQWLDGSFLENIEVLDNRPPRDLDVVTFYGDLTSVDFNLIIANFPEFVFSGLAKINFHLDHYGVDFTFRPDVTVESTRYWIQLFTHNRNGVWKGILRLPLNTDVDDNYALNYLNSLLV